MTSRERVFCALRGEPVDRTPIYGWVKDNLSEEITAQYGSVAAFEDHYGFDMAHIFGSPSPYIKAEIKTLRAECEELTPDILLEKGVTYPAADQDWSKVKEALAHHRARDRFCYLQSPGFFEYYNGVFGIENHLMYLLMYTEEIAELYAKQAEWLLGYVDCCAELGIDCVHISDDWGSQRELMFSPELWRELIKPNLKRVVDYVHAKGMLVSLHSDGCVRAVTDDLAELGFDMIHPWQESAGMSYDLYLENYADRFAILGGVCVQTALGLLPQDEMLAEIRRVFGLMKGKRWICCTTHFVQNHCSMEDLNAAFDLIYRLSRES